MPWPLEYGRRFATVECSLSASRGRLADATYFATDGAKTPQMMLFPTVRRCGKLASEKLLLKFGELPRHGLTVGRSEFSLQSVASTHSSRARSGALFAMALVVIHRSGTLLS
jgi:hypothetical protein